MELVKVFVAGDKYFRPDHVISQLKEILQELPVQIQYDGVELPYPVDHIPLSDDTVVPTGMAWDCNMDDDYGSQGVREYYGRNDTLKGRLGDSDILIIHGAALPEAVLDEAKSLKLIGCMRGGPVNIAAEKAKERGIVLTNSPGKNAPGVAEYTIGLILSHIRHIPDGYMGLHQYQYVQRYGDYDLLGYEISGKKVGLVGFGRVSQALTKILHGFSCDVYAYDPFVGEDVLRQAGVTHCTMEHLLRECDIISLHARGGGKPLIGAEEIAMMKPTALFVNTARGPLVDYTALYAALKDGKIGGAALDVFSLEPFGFYHELLSLPNVTATPHMAGVSRETTRRGVQMIGEEIRRFILGEPLKYQIG